MVAVLGMEMGFCFIKLCDGEYGGMEIKVEEFLGSPPEIMPRCPEVAVLGMKTGFCFVGLCDGEYGGVEIGVEEFLGSQVEGLFCRGDGISAWIGDGVSV